MTPDLQKLLAHIKFPCHYDERTGFILHDTGKAFLMNQCYLSISKELNDALGQEICNHINSLSPEKK